MLLFHDGRERFKKIGEEKRFQTCPRMAVESIRNYYKTQVMLRFCFCASQSYSAFGIDNLQRFLTTSLTERVNNRKKKCRTNSGKIVLGK